MCSYKLKCDWSVWDAFHQHGSICRKFPTKCLVIGLWNAFHLMSSYKVYSEIVNGLSGMLLTWHGSICRKFPTKCLVHDCTIWNASYLTWQHLQEAFLQSASWLGHLECFSPDMAAFAGSFLQSASWLGHLECFCYLRWQHLQEVSYKVPSDCTIWNASYRTWQHL